MIGYECFLPAKSTLRLQPPLPALLGAVVLLHLISQILQAYGYIHARRYDLLAEGYCWATVQSELKFSLVLSPAQLLEYMALSFWQCPAWLDLCWSI